MQAPKKPRYEDDDEEDDEDDEAAQRTRKKRDKDLVIPDDLPKPARRVVDMTIWLGKFQALVLRWQTAGTDEKKRSEVVAWGKQLFDGMTIEQKVDRVAQMPIFFKKEILVSAVDFVAHIHAGQSVP